MTIQGKEIAIISPARDVLARTMYGEARGEGRTGMQAVANVIVNRANKPRWWGVDIKSVCLAPGQFDCWRPEDPNYDALINVTSTDATFAEALALADLAIAGKLEDITGGATHYFNPSIVRPPRWANKLPKTGEVGDHHFYLEA